MPEPDDYLLRIENINVTAEEGLKNIRIIIAINLVPEFRVSVVTIMMTMIFTAIAFVTKFWIGSLRRA